MSRFTAIRQLPSTSFRVGSRLLGRSIPLSLKVSPGSPLRAGQIQSPLVEAARTIQKSFLGRHATFRPVEVWAVSESDLMKLSLGQRHSGVGGKDAVYAAPEQTEASVSFDEAFFSSQESALIVNADAFRHHTAAEMKERLVHELLHAWGYLDTLREGNGSLRIHGGISTSETGRRAQKRFIRERGVALNEGLTEYWRVKIMGGKPAERYQALYEAARTLAETFGERILLDAYFRGKTADLEMAFDAQHGSGAYQELDDLSEMYRGRSPGALSLEESGKLVVRFARFGFESYAMQKWGYTQVDRTRAPRIIRSEVLPADIQSILPSFMRVVTNLTDGELAQLRPNFGNTRNFVDWNKQFGDRGLGLFERVIKREGDQDFLAIRFMRLPERSAPVPHGTPIAVFEFLVYKQGGGFSFPRDLGRNHSSDLLCRIVLI